MEQLGYVMMQLLRWELCGSFSDSFFPDEITPEELMQLLPLSRQHDVSHLAGDAIEQLHLLPDCALSEQYTFQIAQAQFRHERYSHAYNEICDCLESAQISYLPLKGSVLRSVYPEGWMRTSSDIDILIHKNDIEQAKELLLNRLHYKPHGVYTHDVSLQSDDGVRVELHHELVEDGRVCRAASVLSDAWERANPRQAGKYEHCLDDATLCLYHIAHMAKHITTGGCGVRPFADLLMLEKSGRVPHSELSRLLKKAGLSEFAEQVQRLMNIWFSGEKATEPDCLLINYILEGGVHGSRQTAYAIEQLSNGGKARYLLSRMFLPFDKLKYQYPELQKKPWLLPACEIRRWYDLAFGEKQKNAETTLSSIEEISEEKLLMSKNVLEQFGLL